MKRRIFVACCSIIAGICFGIFSYRKFIADDKIFGTVLAILALMQFANGSANVVLSRKLEKVKNEQTTN